MKIELATIRKDVELCKFVQGHLIRIGYLEPPVDGICGAYTEAAFKAWSYNQLSINPANYQRLVDGAEHEFPMSSGFAGAIASTMLEAGYYVARGDARFNIVYLMNSRVGEYDATRIIFEWRRGLPPAILDCWASTCPAMSGQAKGWALGQYLGANPAGYPALLQVVPAQKTLDGVTEQVIGLHHIHGFNSVRKLSTEGMFVGQSVRGHVEFLSILHADVRYKNTNKYLYYTTILDAHKIGYRFKPD